MAYDFAGGIIDASTQGTAGQNGLQIAIGNGSQTVVTGVGNDFVAVTTSDAVDQINIATGGSDIVRFDDLFINQNQQIQAVNPNFHQVLGFDPANDLIQINVAGFGPIGGGIVLQRTDGGAIFGGPPQVFDAPIGTVANLVINLVEIIKFQDIVGAGTAQQFFNSAIGAAGAITVAAAADNIFSSVYSTTQGVAVLMVVHPGADNVININDDVDVVAQIGMTLAQYNAFKSNGTSLLFV